MATLPTNVQLYASKVAGPRVAIVGHIHGNEPVGARVLKHLAGAVSDGLIAGSILAVQANPVAAARDLRHTVGGQDMNRLWDPASLDYAASLPTADRSVEQSRVLELAPWLKTADCILDLHSTSRPAPPFLLFRDDRAHRQLASQLGVLHTVTGIHESGILPGGLAVNVGLQPGEPGTRLGFVLEAGQHQQDGIDVFAWEVAQRLLALMGVWHSAPPPPAEMPRVYEVVDRYAQAPEGRGQYRLITPDRAFREKRRLESFETVDAGEVLAVTAAGRVLRADEPFTMLMPAATAAPGEDLFFTAQQRYGGLGDDIGERELPRVAAGVERILDLVDGDAFERGQSWAGFDSARILDRCADLIGGVLRLPKGHPDRHITVVGPGTLGVDSVEQRRGRRYRQAMRRAVGSGVPVDRYQLLRGTSLSWIDALTSQSTAQRFYDRTDRAPVRMFLSMRQPAAVSVLVCGDLESALREGGRRDVRVAIVVEAPELSAEGDNVDIHVARAALFSGRPEILRAVFNLIGALQDDHEDVVQRQGSLGLPPVLTSGGLVRDHMLHADLDTIRELLRRLQVETWAHALRPVLHDEQHIAAGMLGHWLTKVMCETGIRDAHALTQLLARPTADGWHVSPEYLMQALVDPMAVKTQPHRLPVVPRPEPIIASDVTVDQVEHWIGWKRRMQSLSAIPGTRGRDLDLPLRGSAIHQTLTRLYAWARKRAARTPGEVMVIIAGDGQSPGREPVDHAAGHLLAHRDLVRDANVRYLRIQHSQATHMAWLKDWTRQVAQRGRGGAPIGLHWEHEMGDSVNVVLIATASEDGAVAGSGVLDGWRIEAAGVLISQLERTGGDYAVGLFSHVLDGGIDHANSNMLQFARSHCQSALGTGPVQWTRDAADMDERVIQRISRWIVDARADGGVCPKHADPTLVVAVETAARGDDSPMVAARGMWEKQAAWPGADWQHISASR